MSLSFLDRIQIQRADEQVAQVDASAIGAGKSRHREPVGICVDCGGWTYKRDSVRCCKCSQRHHDKTRVYKPRRAAP